MIWFASTFRELLGGGFKHFYFHPYLGKIPILTNIFQMGWNHQPDYVNKPLIFRGVICLKKVYVYTALSMKDAKADSPQPPGAPSTWIDSIPGAWVENMGKKIIFCCLGLY